MTFVRLAPTARAASVLAVSLLALTLWSASAVAQQPRSLPIAGTPEAPTVRFGADAGFLMSLGDYSKVTGPAVGLLGRFEYPVALNGVFTVRAGYLHGLNKSRNVFGATLRTSISHVPVLAGFKFYPGQQPLQEGGLYLAAEAGPNLMIGRSSVDADFVGESDSGTDLRFAMGFGAGFETGPLDLRGGLYVPHLGDLGDSIGLMITVGFTF